jgi:hypothetical protein
VFDWTSKEQSWSDTESSWRSGTAEVAGERVEETRVECGTRSPNDSAAEGGPDLNDEGFDFWRVSEKTTFDAGGNDLKGQVTDRDGRRVPMRAVRAVDWVTTHVRD